MWLKAERLVAVYGWVILRCAHFVCSTLDWHSWCWLFLLGCGGTEEHMKEQNKIRHVIYYGSGHAYVSAWAIPHFAVKFALYSEWCCLSQGHGTSTHAQEHAHNRKAECCSCRNELQWQNIIRKFKFMKFNQDSANINDEIPHKLWLIRWTSHLFCILIFWHQCTAKCLMFAAILELARLLLVTCCSVWPKSCHLLFVRSNSAQILFALDIPGMQWSLKIVCKTLPGF